MILQPGSLISRTLALTLLLLLLLGGYRLLAQPALERFAANERRIEQLGELLQRYQTLRAEQPDLAERLADLESRDQAASGYWESASDVLIAAKLQDHVSQTVQAHGGSMISMQVVDTPSADNGTNRRRRTSLRIRLTATIDGLAAILQAIETGMPFMFIERLSVTPAGRRPPAGSEALAETTQSLDVRLDLFGYGRAPKLEQGGVEEDSSASES